MLGIFHTTKRFTLYIFSRYFGTKLPISDIKKGNCEKTKKQFYNKKAIKQLLKSKERLIYADDGMIEVVIKHIGIPNFIVDYNDKFGQTNLAFYECGEEIMTSITTTFGSFLNHCNLRA